MAHLVQVLDNAVVRLFRPGAGIVVGRVAATDGQAADSSTKTVRQSVESEIAVGLLGNGERSCRSSVGVVGIVPVGGAATLVASVLEARGRLRGRRNGSKVGWGQMRSVASWKEQAMALVQ